MRTSKYLGFRSGNWECTHVGVASVQPAFTKQRGTDGKRVRSKRAGHCCYYYIFERLTSDKKAMKMIRLGYWQAKKVFSGEHTVEHFAKKKEAKRSQAFTHKVSYSFCD
jgi:hypothetical protein